MTRRSWVRRQLGRLTGPAVRLARRRRYERQLARGEPAGDYSYVERTWTDAPAALVDLHLRVSGRDDAERSRVTPWCQSQTLAEIRVLAWDVEGVEAWRIEPPTDGEPGRPALWFAAPGGLPEALPAQLESALLVAAAEEIDAVVLRERVSPPLDPSLQLADAVTGPELRPWTLYSASAFAYEPSTDSVRPLTADPLVKLVDTNGVGDLPRDVAHFGRTRRGPYLSSRDMGPVLEVGVRDVAALERPRRRPGRPTVLVLGPFLARGGAEHTLFETLRVLTDELDFIFATLAPHRPSLDDRRPEFRAISEHLYCSATWSTRRPCRASCST